MSAPVECANAYHWRTMAETMQRARDEAREQRDEAVNRAAVWRQRHAAAFLAYLARDVGIDAARAEYRRRFAIVAPDTEGVC